MNHNHREEHPTNDAHRPGKIRYGDISHWATATAKPVRPDVPGRHLGMKSSPLAKLPKVSAVEYRQAASESKPETIHYAPETVIKRMPDSERVDRALNISDTMNAILFGDGRIGSLCSASVEAIVNA